ncbi:divergent polysaccharide deacetylase family protein [Aureimonas leprariae]|uniref:Divergent polysaccharide deacetylase family protein n=1 Tax=Plantimonas leprariae TaxID=2615207 RepID=A0A7V7PRG3_9HYPH|nr:divergent polysaccharide deacetylase family protein [Aureimonas leprariae]KAB0681292.1 hypothetical protein F6X38_05215 [Aureimonas leprariae]
MDTLYRPLGLDLGRRKPRRRGRSAIPALAGTLCFALLVGGSLAVSLTQPRFRDVDVFATHPAPPEPLAVAAANPPPASPPAAGPAVTAAPLQPLGRTSAGADDAAVAAADPDAPTIVYPPGAEGGYGKALSMRDPGSLRQAASEAAEPDAALLEHGAEGLLPIRAADGRRPFDVYSIAPASDLGTRVAIVVGGLGISQTGTMKAVRELDPAVTLAFAPAGNSLERWMREARHAGHELLLQLPMEPVGYPNVSPGEHTLTAGDAAAGRFDDLRWALGRLTNYVGVANYMGARLTGDEPAMRALAAELSRRGLLYLDDGTSARSLAKSAAREAGGVYAGADVVLDTTQDPAEIRKRLDTLERAARAKGQAIGVASAFDMSVAAIAAWMSEAEARGIKVVPVSALADDPEAQ